jgi:mRNA-degrading endonuclease RelE of RelBE toxin-antitoxin system
MQVIMQKRAEVALRSLDARDRDRVSAAVSRLEQTGFRELSERGQIKKLRQAPGVILYVMRATNWLRIVLSFQNDRAIVEDIVPYDRLDRLPSNWR